jgi:hypothetical protein
MATAAPSLPATVPASAGLLLQRLGRGEAVHQTQLARALGVDELAGGQHLERRLARHVAGQRHHGRRAEEADIDPVHAEAGIAGATAMSQLATSWQPAAVAMPWTWRSPAAAGRGSSA